MIRFDRAILIGISLIAGVPMLFLIPRLSRAGKPHQAPTVVQLAESLRDRPADWVAFSTLSEYALDTTLPHRFDLWRRSFAHAHALAPLRPNPQTAFVRGGLFHWYELEESQRSEVKSAAVPVLRDGSVFPVIASNLLSLTGDFELLVRNNPGRLTDLQLLRDLAVNSDDFAHYRFLRDAATRKQLDDFRLLPADSGLPHLIAALPVSPGEEHRPLIQQLLDRLNVRPASGSSLNPGVAGELIDFVIRRHMKPLEGLEPLMIEPASAPPTERARLAVALGNLDAASQIRASDSQPDTIWRQYYIERALAEEAGHDPTAAEADLVKASGGELRAEILDAAARGALIRGDLVRATMLRERLIQQFSTDQWSGLCGEILCRSASSTRYFSSPTLQLRLRRSTARGGSDPYVEIRVDGRRVIEGPVGDSTWEIPVGTGVHTVSVSLINPGTSADQRGVRMS